MFQRQGYIVILLDLLVLVIEALDYRMLKVKRMVFGDIFIGLHRHVKVTIVHSFEFHLPAAVC